MKTAQKLLLMSGQRYLDLTATTTTPAESVTITQLTPTGGSVVIDWGDGSSTEVANGSASAISHTYAADGTYRLRVNRAHLITGLRLDNAKLGGLNTAQLRNSPITTFIITAITNSTINSADMSNWRPTTWRCYSMPSGGSYTINSAHMVDWRPTNWQLYSMLSGGTYTISTSHMTDWRPAYWYCNSMPAGGSYTINSADMVDWRPTYWYCYSMPSGGAYTINTSHMTDWRPTDWRCYAMPSGSITIGASPFATWITTTELRIDSNALSQAQVDAILAGLWSGFASRTATGGTINVGGTNAAPSGIYQAANPPTTGKEYCYELVNDTGGVNPTKKWATVTFTA